jgi:hypothetical protein
MMALERDHPWFVTLKREEDWMPALERDQSRFVTLQRQNAWR